MVMYGYVGLCMAVYGCVWLCIAMYGCVALCTAIERNVFHILANGEPLYDAYTTYLPKHVTSMGRHLSVRYGRVILVSGYFVLTAVN